MEKTSLAWVKWMKPAVDILVKGDAMGSNYKIRGNAKSAE